MAYNICGRTALDYVKPRQLLSHLGANPTTSASCYQHHSSHKYWHRDWTLEADQSWVLHTFSTMLARRSHNRLSQEFSSESKCLPLIFSPRLQVCILAVTYAENLSCDFILYLRQGFPKQRRCVEKVIVATISTFVCFQHAFNFTAISLSSLSQSLFFTCPLLEYWSSPRFHLNFSLLILHSLSGYWCLTPCL